MIMKYFFKLSENNKSLENIKDSNLLLLIKMENKDM